MTVPADKHALRDLIREQATRLFAARGFAGTSIREVAEACSCTKPALYYYFSSKGALFREVVEHHMAAFDELLLHAVASTGPFRQRIHTLLGDIIDHCIENPCAVRLLHRIEASPEDTAPVIDASAARAAHEHKLARLIEQGIATGELRSDLIAEEGALILSAVVHTQFEVSMASNEWDRERIHRTIDLVLDGIAT